MSDLTIQFFGQFRVTLDGQPLGHFRTNKVQALLAYLACEPGVTHRREALMTLLWPEMPQDSAQTNLRQIIYQLRRILPEVNSNEAAGRVPFILSERQTVQINPAADFASDVAQFEELLAASRRHVHCDSVACLACRERLEHAVRLYEGPFLADFYLEDSNEFEDWAHHHREALRRQVRDTLSTLAAGSIRSGDYAGAQGLAWLQLDMDNLDEPAYRQLMEALARDGHRHEAMSVYEDAVILLRDELGMSPTMQTARLAELIESDSLTAVEPPSPTAVRGYELRDVIGAGAFGVVHRAYQPVVGREVAIKIVRPRYANQAEFIRRFEAEAQTVARLEHPHIVPLYDYWREPDGAFLVMRWLRGGNLANLLGDGPLPPSEVARMVNQLADALQAAHRQRVIHRDVKAANILLDEEHNAYLSDFSVAKDLSADGQVLDPTTSPETISPEQLLGEQLTPLTDQYSLGMVIYQMLTGESPRSRTPLDQLEQQILNEPLPLVAAQVPGIPQAVDDVLQQATARKPGSRYSDTAAFNRAFQRAIGNEPFHAPASLSESRVGRSAKATAAAVDNPYLGLRAFQESDVAAFFGREDLITQLAARLDESDEDNPHRARFLALVGPSGGGKSSVVKAGLLPALRHGRVANSERWFITEMTPGRHPLEELELALLRVAVDPPVNLLEPLQRDSSGLVHVLNRILPRDNPDETPQLLLVIDQFEEMFTLTEDDQESAQFLANLITALREPDSRLRVVITLRADFYDRPLQIAELGDLLRYRTEVVLPLSPLELEQAITLPAARTGVGFEPGLVSAIMADVAGQPGTLPLLQYALTELFERRDGNTMTYRTYQDIGRVAGALGRRADEIYDSTDSAGQEAIRQLFLRLVTLGEGVEDTRRRILRAELQGLNIPDADMEALITQFGRYRLLTFDRDVLTREATVEVAHEALLREWPRLRNWLDEGRAEVRLQRLLAIEAAEWRATGHDEGYLLRGSRLDQFEDWAVQSTVLLTTEEVSFLAASLEARTWRRADEELRRRRELETARQLAATESQRAAENEAAASQLRRRAMLLAAALVAAGMLALTAVGFARSSNENAGVAATRAAEANANAALAVENANLASTRQVEAGINAALAVTREAEALAEAGSRATAESNAAEQRDVALVREREARESYSLSLAANARQALEADDQQLALLLALAANTIDNPPLESWRTLLDVAYAPGAIQVYQAGSPVNSVVLSPDGRRMLTGGEDGLLREWDVASGDLLQALPGNHGAVLQVAYNKDGTQALSGADDNRVLLWDVAGGKPIREMVGHSAPVRAVAFLPDGRHALTGEDTRQLQGTAILWDLETGQEVLRFGGDFAGQLEGILSIAVNNDGHTALIGYRKGSALDTHTAALWDLETGELIRFLGGSDRDMNSVAISEDGALGFGASADSLIHVWDLATGEQVHLLNGHQGVVTSIALHKEGLSALSGALDGEVILWDLTTWQPVAHFYGHTDTVWSTAFESDSVGVSASVDGTMRRWDLDGNWQVDRWRDPAAPPDHLVQQLRISPDGRYVVTVSWQRFTGSDPLMTLWDYESGSPLRYMGPIESPIAGIAFTPDSRKVVTAHDDGSIGVWDLETGQFRNSFVSHAGYAFDVEVSSDGQFVISTGIDDQVIYQELANGQILSHLIGHFEGRGVLDGAFLPGDQQAISGGWDGTLIVWDLVTDQQVQRLTGLTSDVGGHLYADGQSAPAVNKVVVTNDGRYALSAANDRSLILWDLISGKSIRRLTGHSQPVYSTVLTPDGTRALSVAANDPMILWDLSTGKAIRQFPIHRIEGAEFAPEIDMHPSGQAALTTDVDGSIIKWQLAVPDAVELVDWIAANRALRDLTCLERESFQIEPLCSGEANLSTTAQLMESVRHSVQSLTLGQSSGGIVDSREPAAMTTPPSQPLKVAVLGENRGEIERGSFDVWLYEGHTGEVLNMRMMADRPLSDPTIPLEQRFEAGILDTMLYITRPDGSLLQHVDDVMSPDLVRLSDAQLEGVKLPFDGVYRIEARSALDDLAGPYSLFIEEQEPYWNAELYEDYVGHYIEGPWRYDTFIFIEDNRLMQVFDFTGVGGFENVPLNDTDFMSEADASLTRFTRDENGQVTGYSILVGLIHNVGGQWYFAERVGDLPPGFLESRRNAP